jgi:hypothetical protein
MVAMMITGIVLAICGTFFANVAKLTAASNSSRDATGQAALALDAIGSVVRVAADNATSATTTAPAVVAGTAASLTVTAWTDTDSADPAPSLVTFSIGADGYLTRTTISGVAVDGYYIFTGALSSKRIGGPFVTVGAAPFFSYLDNTGTLLPLGGQLSTTQRTAVTFVGVTATVAHRDAAGESDPVVVTSAIGMPNLDRDVSGGSTIQQVPIPITTPALGSAP